MNESALPAPDEVAFYRRHGWYITRPIVSTDLLDDLRRQIELHQMRPPDQRLPSAIGHTDWGPGDGPGVRNSEFISVQCPAMRQLSLLPEIGEIAARLAGAPSIRLFDDQAVVKPPGDPQSTVGWHTDHSYWSTCTSTEMLTAWVPFDDTSADDGTLMVVDGSHRWPEVEHLRGFNEPDLGSLAKRLGRPVPDEAMVPLELKKGQVSFHHMRIAHASGPNRTDRSRVALAIHYQDDANEHRVFRAADDSEVVLPHDRLCGRRADGHPDYRDPEVFPEAWSGSKVG